MPLCHYWILYVKYKSLLPSILLFIVVEASGQRRGAAAWSVTVKPTGCEFDPHSRRWNIYLNLYFHFFALESRLNAALSSATQHAMPPKFGRKWGTEYLNTRFPLPTLLCAGYSVKLIYIYFLKILFRKHTNFKSCYVQYFICFLRSTFLTESSRM